MFALGARPDHKDLFVEIDAGLSADLNDFGPNSDYSGVESLFPDAIMRGHDDWANLQYGVIASAATAETVAIRPIITGAPPVLFYRLRLQLLDRN